MKTIPFLAAEIGRQLTKKGFSESNPCKVKATIVMTIDSYKYTYSYTMKTSSVFPKDGTIYVKGTCEDGSVITEEIYNYEPEDIENDPNWKYAEFCSFDIRNLARALFKKRIFAPFECELYSIVEYGKQTPDEKSDLRVELVGFLWQDDGPWHFTETRQYGIPVAEFAQKYKEYEEHGKEYVTELQVDARQYEQEMNRKEALEYILAYFNGRQADENLHYSEITTDTPAGNYIVF